MDKHGGEKQFEIMSMIKSVIDYSGLNYNEVLELPFDIFLQMRRNSYVDALMQTEDGRKYLDDCERYQTTDMDIDGLKKLFGKEEK